MSGERKNQSRIFCYIPKDLHDLLKQHCEKMDTTITKYVTRSLVMRLNMELKTENRIKY